MRLWSLHPKYLDQKGLTALWREALLAQKVLRGGTRGYRNHPQLVRFRGCGKPLAAIAIYLLGIRTEAARRGYSFDRGKIGRIRTLPRIPVPRGQMEFEWSHLLAKVALRDRARCRALRKVARPAAHPLFRIVRGGVAEWEKGPAGTGAGKGNHGSPIARI